MAVLASLPWYKPVYGVLFQMPRSRIQRSVAKIICSIQGVSQQLFSREWIIDWICFLAAEKLGITTELERSHCGLFATLFGITD